MKLSILKLYFKANKPVFASLAILAMLAVIFSQFILPLQSTACAQPQPSCGSPQLTIDKKMKNLSSQDSAWSDLINTDPGQKLAVQIIIKNIGTAIANNVFSRDVLPDKLNYITGSTKVDGSSVSDGLTSNGINLGNLAINGTKTIYFEVNVADFFEQGLTTLTNIAYARADKVSEISDTAKVVICQIPTIKDLSISKTVRNITAGQNNFSESTDAVNNDRVAFQIQIQNTGNDVLNNVFVRDVLPSYISYLGGTTRVGNQTVSDGITNGGINLGSIAKDGSTTVTFEATINYSGTTDQTLINTAFARADQVSEKSDTAEVLILDPDLSINKTVRNITSGQNYFSESINAQNNDRIAFQIQVQNTGAVNLTNVMVRDVLPSYLSYAYGTTQLDGSLLGDGIISGGINIGSLSPAVYKTVTFEANINFSGSGNQTLTNTAYARADQVNEKSDVATVYISGTSYSYDLTITKTVRDETAGQYSYSDAINANNGDQLMFQIQIQNTGNSNLNNIFVRDLLPSGFNYISGSTRVDGSFVSDGIVSGGINTGSLVVNGIRTITFEASVNVYGSYGAQTLTNTAYARADQVSEKSDTATAYVSQQNIYGNLNIVKYVRNQTAGQSSLSTSANASSGDRVTFTIQISTLTSNQQVNNVRVWDSLPSGLTLVSGTARLDGVFVSDVLVSSGINLGTLVGNQTRTITFDAMVNSNLSNQTLTNVAYVTGDNVPQQSASAQVIIGQVTPYNPSATLTKKVANLTSPNGNDTDNTASVGNTLQYTITLTNNGPGVLNNIRLTDVLPPYTTFQAADSNGSYDSSSNQVTWYNGNLANGTSLSFTYRVTVQAVPYNGYVITNTASASADNLGAINSNEVRTTVGGIVKGAIKVVTGGDSLPRNLALAGVISLWSIFIVYLLMEYGNFWRGARLKWAILKLKLKGKLS